MVRSVFDGLGGTMRKLLAVLLPASMALVGVACDDNENNAQVPASGKATTPILGIHHLPSLTRERYEEVVRRLTSGKSRLESPADVGVGGLLVHVAGQGADGFWIVDIWESQEAVDRFKEVIGPIAREAGIEEPMKTYAVHTFVSASIPHG
jgi:hypothetical protein